MHLKTFSIKGFLTLCLLAGLTTFALASISFAREPIRTVNGTVYEHLAPHQYRVAKQDFEYFMRLLDLAIAYYRDGVPVEGGKRVTAAKV